MAAATPAAFPPPAVKRGSEDDEAMFDGEVGVVGLLGRGFVGHDAAGSTESRRSIKKKRARGWGNHGPKSGYRGVGLWGGTAAEEKHLDGWAGCRTALATSEL